MIPKIAILCPIDKDKSVSLLNTYTNAIESSGGLPFIVPYTKSDKTIKEYVSCCDGILFSGGCDIEPQRYGESTLETCGNIQLYRDELELKFFREAFEQRKPIMAICRGMQLVNVALGGSLYQDLPTQLPSEISHRQTEPKDLPSHTVRIISDTPLMELVGKERMIANSFHHQAIKSIGAGLEVMAIADDGIIEAVHYTGKNYVMGFQWHPERLYSDSDNRNLFFDFINEAKKARKD